VVPNKPHKRVFLKSCSSARRRPQVSEHESQREIFLKPVHKAEETKAERTVKPLGGWAGKKEERRKRGVGFEDEWRTRGRKKGALLRSTPFVRGVASTDRLTEKEKLQKRKRRRRRRKRRREERWTPEEEWQGVVSQR
jgi:hypothetical protein